MTELAPPFVLAAESALAEAAVEDPEAADAAAEPVVEVDEAMEEADEADEVPFRYYRQFETLINFKSLSV